MAEKEQKINRREFLRRTLHTGGGLIFASSAGDSVYNMMRMLVHFVNTGTDLTREGITPSDPGYDKAHSDRFSKKIAQKGPSGKRLLTDAGGLFVGSQMSAQANIWLKEPKSKDNSKP